MLTIQATTLNRVMACNGSVAMGGDKPPIEPASDDKLEGIAAHYIAAQTLSGYISDPLEYLDKQMPNGVYVTVEMAEFIGEFTSAIQERWASMPLAQHGAAVICDFDITPSVRVVGKTECYTFDPATDTLYIDDLRYGWRIVEPENNWTMIASAIGCMMLMRFKPAKIVFTIFQPRPYHRDGNIRSWPITDKELNLLHIALTLELNSLKDQVVTGEHCRDCAAIAVCAAARKAGANAIEASSNVFSDEISDEVLAFELDNLDAAAERIEQRRNALKELALFRIPQGRNIPNYILEHAKGKTKWNDTVTAEMLQIMTGKDLTVKKLLSPTQAKKAGVPDELIKTLSERPNIGVRLVRVDLDKHAKKLLGE